MNQLPLKRNRLLVIALSTIFAMLAFDVNSASALQDDLFTRPSDKKATAEAGSGTKATETNDGAETESEAAAKTKESTAQIEQQSDGWYTVIDDASNVEVRLPGEPKYKELSWSPIAGRPPLTNHFYNSLSADKQISADYSWYDMHEAPATPQALKNALDGAVKGSVVNVFGELKRMDAVRSGKVSGREFEFDFTLNLPSGKSATMHGRSRIFIQDKRRYQLTVINYVGKGDSDLTDKLFESLLIKDD